jgi:hypothetical protein
MVSGLFFLRASLACVVRDCRTIVGRGGAAILDRGQARARGATAAVPGRQRDDPDPAPGADRARRREGDQDQTRDDAQHAVDAADVRFHGLPPMVWCHGAIGSPDAGRGL